MLCWKMEKKRMKPRISLTCSSEWWLSTWNVGWRGMAV